jgi:diacylglycerol kinase (ATP)
MLNKSGFTGLKRIQAASVNSYRGLRAVWRTEEAFRQEVFLILLLALLAFWLDVSVVERLLLLGSLVGVIVAELINTALEYVVDRISIEQHPLSGSIKDIGSAVVLLSFGFAVLLWGYILLHA